MKDVLKAARELVSAGLYQGEACHISKLEAALKAYDAQLAKHAERRKIKLTKCIKLKARAESGSKREIILEPGDLAIVIGSTKDGIIVESTDPSHIQFAVPFADEKITWEYAV